LALVKSISVSMIHNYRFNHAMVQKQARGIRKNNLSIFCCCPGSILASPHRLWAGLGLILGSEPKGICNEGVGLHFYHLSCFVLGLGRLQFKLVMLLSCNHTGLIGPRLNIAGIWGRGVKAFWFDIHYLVSRSEVLFKWGVSSANLLR